ncbi:MAG: ATP-binding cassette domain-containing protein [Oligoflexia bacterium]|nr:ATP-binding cassette domain-containing protein [Oligoflexia bacterium]MBF0364356.1 ATP-binding cassette domain-containing protein [Oligoflexia bacterium]
MNPLIEVQGLSFAYKSAGGPIKVLSDLNLSIHQGEMISIEGRSGSGKSTLLYLLGGVLKIKYGNVLIDHKNIKKLSPLQIALFRNHTIGFVYQQFHLLSHATVLENILLPLSYPVECPHAISKADAKTRAKEIAKLLEIEELLHRYPSELSGGQQQRTAIARALICDPKIILADEPTGNLDSKTATEIVNLFKKLVSFGKTIIIVTHDRELSSLANKTYYLQDGTISKVSNHAETAPVSAKAPPFAPAHTSFALFKLLPIVFDNLRRKKLRSALTLLGVAIGIAAMFSMVTIGIYTKNTLLDSFNDLGANTLTFSGHRNWNRKATDIQENMFESFHYEHDIINLKKTFPSISKLTPNFYSWDSSVVFGGKALDTDIKVLAINDEGWDILNRPLSQGKYFSRFHLDNKSGVCVIGADISKQLFENFKISPLKRVILIKGRNRQYPCTVIGVMSPKTSNDEWMKPNMQIYIPFTYYTANSSSLWESRIYNFTMQAHVGSDIEKLGKMIKAYFEKKYGNSGMFSIGTDSVLIAQMEKFLNLFSIIIGALAAASLLVGGVGVANMMMVALSERYREIGVRKAVGATDRSILWQFLIETLILCALAGIFGIVIGFAFYESMIYVAGMLVPKVKFQWIFEWGAMSISLLSILVVGILSGLFPALKAKQLQVIEALRAE